VIETPVPERIHRDDREIVVTWSAEHVSRYPARRLRLQCHCAMCREEMTGNPLLDPDTVPEDVRPERVELVGGYGIRIAWSDGHGTGIYTYRYLNEICPCERCTEARRHGGSKQEGRP
jgi:ATP-binding protein involved in chromosome partitioning